MAVLSALRSLAVLVVLVGACSRKDASNDARTEPVTSATTATNATSAPSTDFRLQTAPNPGRKIGTVLSDRAGKAFVEVLGADVPDHVAVNEPIVVRTYFKVLGTTATDYEITMHINSVPPRSLYNADHTPMSGQSGRPSPYPTSQWKTGELLVDTATAHLQRAGTYEVLIWFDAPGSGTLLKPTSGPSKPDGPYVSAGMIEVK